MKWLESAGKAFKSALEVSALLLLRKTRDTDACSCYAFQSSSLLLICFDASDGCGLSCCLETTSAMRVCCSNWPSGKLVLNYSTALERGGCEKGPLAFQKRMQWNEALN